MTSTERVNVPIAAQLQCANGVHVQAGTHCICGALKYRKVRVYSQPGVRERIRRMKQIHRNQLTPELVSQEARDTLQRALTVPTATGQGWIEPPSDPSLDEVPAAAMDAEIGDQLPLP